jgi:hypothetical protein
MHPSFSLWHRCARFVAGCALILLPATAMADSPAAISDASRSRAEDQFHQFAKTWMANVQRLQTQDRDKPTVRAGANGTQVSYRGYGDDYSWAAPDRTRKILRRLLRYTDWYSCPSASSRTARCRRAFP